MTKYLLATSTAVLMGIAFSASLLRAEEGPVANPAHAPNPTETQEKHPGEVKDSTEAEKHVDGEHAKKHPSKKHHCKHCKHAKKHHAGSTKAEEKHEGDVKKEHEGKPTDEPMSPVEKAPTDAAEPTKAVAETTPAAETHEK